MSDYDVKNQKKTSDTPDEQSDESSKLKKTIRREEKSVKNYQFFALRLILILAVIWVLFFVIVGVAHMPSADMYPRIDMGDFVLFYRLDKDVKAQDIIVLEKEVPCTSRYEGYTEYPLTLQEGECFVLADSRNGGTDSRFFGPVTRDEIDGTVITIVRRNNL